MARTAQKAAIKRLCQVSNKLARFGATRGTIIASLVLLCNVVFIYMYVTTTVSECEQRVSGRTACVRASPREGSAVLSQRQEE